MSKFKFELNQAVQIICSGERGEIIGRAEYAANETAYYVRYKAADGRACECWWNESAIAAIA